jgi:mono/diheme cytochrome c family protein
MEKERIHVIKSLVVVGLALVSGAAAAAPPSTPQLLEKGKSVFLTTCVPCHGEKGDGAGAAAAALEPKPRNFSETFKKGHKLEDVFKTLSEGLPPSAMVSFSALPEEDRWALSYYVLELRKDLEKGKAPAPAKAAAKKGK